MKIVYDYMMSEKNITVIVPRLPPSVDGLGDYGILLGRILASDHATMSNFIVCDPTWNGPAIIDDFNVQKLSKRTKTALLQKLNHSDIIILHYVGYGYARRGCPLWLMRALGEWKKTGRKKLVTMVHECYAFGPVWNSQFWTSPLQRFILKKIAQMSDHLVTSKQSYAEIIKKYSDKTAKVLPVFSNVGEGKKDILSVGKENVSVVFGGSSWRRKVYAEEEKIKALIDKLNIKKIIDIGSPVLEIQKIKNIVEVQEKGICSAEEISKILSFSKYGFINYPTAYLSKSGIFASYCSHGMIPISFWSKDLQSDGVLPNIHFLNWDECLKLKKEGDFQKIAENALNWYSGHTVIKHAELFNELIEND